MVSAPELYRAMLRDLVGPALRDLGFRGSAGTYRLNDDRAWVLLQFQSSMANHAGYARFTINLAVTGKAGWAQAREWWREQWPDASPLPPRPSAGVVYPGKARLAWSRRIGQLLPANRDFWWEIDPDEPVTPVAESVMDTVGRHGLPALIRERDRLPPEGAAPVRGPGR